MKRLIVLTALFLAFGALGLVIWPIIRDVQHARQTELVRNDLKQIMLALHNYHDQHHSFPPAFVVGPDGKRWHSWRALVLKDLAPELAKQYRFNEPWDGPHNSKLHQLAPAVLQSDLATGSNSASHYLAIIGKRTVWPADQPTKIRDITHGTSNTMMLVEHRGSDTCWLAPSDIVGLDAVKILKQSTVTSPDHGACFALTDGSVRATKTSFSKSVLGSLMTAASKDLYQGDNWPPDLVASLPDGKLKQPQDVVDLYATEISAIRSGPFSSDTNRLWCASLQIAWDDLKLKLGGDIVPVSLNHLIQAMNGEEADRNILSAQALFVGCSFGGPTAEAKLQRNLDQRFPDIKYRLQSTSVTPVIRVVTAIRKQMPFAEEFVRMEDGLTFQNSQHATVVENFGYKPQGNTEGPIYEDQLTIMDDKGDDNFIVRLGTIGPQKDHIYLAMIPFEKTLEAAWTTVERRCRTPARRHALEASETLRIPVMDFSVYQKFPDLQVPITVGDETMKIDVVYQDIRLKLDETGADFASVAEIALIAAFEDEEPAVDPNRTRHLIFDQPFFVAFQEPNADEPYFMAWIGNDQLMQPMPAIK